MKMMTNEEYEGCQDLKMEIDSNYKKSIYPVYIGHSNEITDVFDDNITYESQPTTPIGWAKTKEDAIKIILKEIGEKDKIDDHYFINDSGKFKLMITELDDYCFYSWLGNPFHGKLGN